MKQSIKNCAIGFGGLLVIGAFGPSITALGPSFEWAEKIPAPDNTIGRMVMAFFGSIIFFHGALLTKLLENEVWLRAIDYFWFGGSILSIAVGLWRLEVDVTNQRELDRWRDSAIATIAAIVHRLDEAEGALTVVDSRQRLRDICNFSGMMKDGSAGHEYCAAVRKGNIEIVCKLPSLPDYAFDSKPETDHGLRKIFKLLDRLLGLPMGVRERQFELARRVVCQFRQPSTLPVEVERSTEELLSAIDRGKEVIGVGPTVQLMALILAFFAGLRITKTTAEIKKARGHC